MGSYLEFNKARWNYVAEHRLVPYTVPLTHDEFLALKDRPLEVYLTPEKPVPLSWFERAPGRDLLGLACGGGQQGPLFAAHGYTTCIMDYSVEQLASDQQVAEREGLSIRTVEADMTERFPFADESFDIIFCPVSNVYVEDISNMWRESFRVLRRGGLLMVGYMNPWVYIFDGDVVWDHPEEEPLLAYPLPYNARELEAAGKITVRPEDGYEFSHTLDEQIGGQLRAGFALIDFYEARDETNPLATYSSDYLANLSIKL